MQPGELIVAVRLPPPAFASHARYLKARDRASYAFALASAAAALRIEGGVIAQARIALGGVAHETLAGARGGSLAARRRDQREAFAKAGAPALKDARAGRRQRLSHRTRAARRRPRADLGGGGTPKTLPALPASPFGA